MKLNILAFGAAKEILGSGKIELDFEAVTVKGLKSALIQFYPGLGNLSSFSIALNSEYVSHGTIINQGDEIAIIPPVSGG